MSAKVQSIYGELPDGRIKLHPLPKDDRPPLPAGVRYDRINDPYTQPNPEDYGIFFCEICKAMETGDHGIGHHKPRPPDPDQQPSPVKVRPKPTISKTPEQKLAELKAYAARMAKENK